MAQRARDRPAGNHGSLAPRWLATAVADRVAAPGRPPISAELRALIRRMATENRLWSEERIANELLLKLGIRVSPRTVRKYMPKPPRG